MIRAYLAPRKWRSTRSIDNPSTSSPRAYRSMSDCHRADARGIVKDGRPYHRKSFAIYAMKPLSTAIKAAASASGMNPISASLRSRSFQQLRGRDHRLGDLGDFLALVHRSLAQQGIGRFFREILRGHENALGAVDHLAFLKRGARALELVPQTGEGVEARDAEIEDGLDALLAQAPDDVGGDAGVDGSLDRGLVALIDEHGDGSLHRPADLEHLLEHVAARVLEVDQDDVGVEGVDASEQVRGLVQAHDVNVASLAQPVLQDRRADRILIDDDDVERRLHGRRRQFSSSVPSSLERGFSSPINSLSAKPFDRPKIRRRPHGAILGRALSKDAAPTPSARMSTGGAFRLRPNRAFISARWFSPDAPPERPRSSDEQGAPWNKAWQCGGFEVPAIVAAGSLRNFKSKTTLES